MCDVTRSDPADVRRHTQWSYRCVTSLSFNLRFLPYSYKQRRRFCSWIDKVLRNIDCGIKDLHRIQMKFEIQISLCSAVSLIFVFVERLASPSNPHPNLSKPNYVAQANLKASFINFPRRLCQSNAQLEWSIKAFCFFQLSSAVW